MDGKINPALVKAARDAAVSLSAGGTKEGFVAADAMGVKQSQGPGMMPPGGGGMPPPGGGMAPPMGGVPPMGGPPMDPSMMGAPPGMPGAPPMDPSMMGAPPGMPPGAPPPGAEGGMGGQPVMVGLQDLVQLFQSIAAESGGGGGGGGGLPPGEPTETNIELGKRLEGIESAINDLADMLQQLTGGPMPPPGAAAEAGAQPPPPELLDAISAGAAPGEAGAMGGPLPPDAAASVAGPGPMPVTASGGGDGQVKTSAVSVARLAQKLRRK